MSIVQEKMYMDVDDVCANDRTGFWTVSEVHSVDRIDFAFVYRRKHDQRICAE